MYRNCQIFFFPCPCIVFSEDWLPQSKMILNLKGPRTRAGKRDKPFKPDTVIMKKTETVTLTEAVTVTDSVHNWTISKVENYWLHPLKQFLSHQ